MKNFYVILFISFFYGNIHGQTFSDPNFSYTIVDDGWVKALGAAYTKDAQRLFVWEQAGYVYVCNKNGSTYTRQTTPVINLTVEVLNWQDNGLLGFALDPDFLNNGYIYLLYAVDRRFLMNNNSIVADAGLAATIGRVTRYKTILSGSNLVADLATRTILIGETKSTGIPMLHESHGIGSLAFAADGTLLVSAGDAASFIGEDYGSNSDTYYAQALTDGIIRPEENVGAFRAQMLNSYNGKLLRIDPSTGNGVTSNPFYSAAEPRSPKSRVWALGFRNPFRFIVRPGTGSDNPATGDIGEVYVGDVGWETWEDLNIITGPGMNFGWPLYEGQTINSRYSTYAATIVNGDEPNPLAGGAGCTRSFFTFRELLKDPTPDDNTTLYNPCNALVEIGTGNRYVHRRPALDYSHLQNSSRVGIFSGNNPAVAEIGTPASGVTGTPFKGNCVVAGMWYTGNDFPAEYKNKFFLADWGGKWVKRLSIDYTDAVTRVDNFSSNFEWVVSMAENPVDGTVAVVNMGFPPVGILDYGGNQPPAAKPVANATYGSSPLTVNFTGNTSFDSSPGGSISSYSWNFGGGSPATSTAANPGNVVFTDATGNPKKFVVKLTVTDNGGATHTDSIIISVNNTPPVVSITSPIKNSTYIPGSDTTYACTADVTDTEHSPAQLKYEWQTFLRHNTHEHAGAIDNNVSTSTTISRIGCNGDSYSWFIKLKVTDGAGLSTIDSVKLFPDCLIGPDIIPPTVSTVMPVNGATEINAGTIVTAIFNEAIDVSTVNETTFQLKDAGNNLVAASINTSTNQITLTPSAALAGSTIYTVTIKSGASGVKDLAGNALVNDYTWSFTTATADNIAPNVISVSPLNGAAGVIVNTTITASFNEAINAATVTATTFQLKDAGNNIIPAGVNTSTSQITLTPSTALAASTIYTVTIKSGAAGVKDLAGNALVSDYSWSFTTAAGITSNIFQPGDLPNSPRSNDGKAIVLGVKFRASQNGLITGVRYYKGAGTTGIHIGQLWSSTGIMLAQATFTNETASGWQQVLFSSPVAITAGVTYVASYHSPSGDFAATGSYFTQAVVNGPLRALADGEDGVNGLYKYSATAAFPANGYQASNYWADVVFTTGSSNTPPVITLQPVSQLTCTGSNVNFSSAATGSPAPTVQWQSSTTGTTWVNIAGATNSSLTFTATSDDNNKQYRAVWTNSIGPVSSNPATLTVNPVPGAPTVEVVNNCGNSVLTASSFTGSLLWSNGATTPSITVTTGGSYTVTQTVNGCTSAPGNGMAAPLSSSVAAPIVNVVNNCGNSVLTASAFTGSLLWSSDATTASITVVTGGIYTVTQTLNGCTSTAASGTAVPKPIPALTSSLIGTATSGTEFTYIPASTVGATTFAWSRAEVSGISNVAASGSGNISETLINTTSSPVNITYVYTLTANGCTNTQNLIVTVNPVSTINCLINGSITSNLTNTAIPAGRFIWFNSVIDRGNFSAVTGTVIFTITNSKITFTVNNQQYTLTVPNATIQFDAAVTSANTQFINDTWVTSVPRSYNNFAFMTGLSYQVPSDLPGNISGVKWTADISVNKTGITPAWKWAAAVYNNFASHAGLNIKPINGNSQNPYLNNDKAGTPENFKTSLVSSGKGSAASNYTGNYSSTNSATCTVASGQRSAKELATLNPKDTIEVKESLQVEVMPNPTNSFFNLVINARNKNPVTILVFDVLGQVIERHEKVASNSKLSVGHKWASGYYFVNVTQDGLRKFVKVIKVN